VEIIATGKRVPYALTFGMEFVRIPLNPVKEGGEPGHYWFVCGQSFTVRAHVPGPRPAGFPPGYPHALSPPP